jgi:hypothetical protein
MTTSPNCSLRSLPLHGGSERFLVWLSHFLSHGKSVWLARAENDGHLLTSKTRSRGFESSLPRWL